MTRWARANNSHKTQPSDATPWQELKEKKSANKLNKSNSEKSLNPTENKKKKTSKLGFTTDVKSSNRKLDSDNVKRTRKSINNNTRKKFKHQEKPDKKKLLTQKKFQSKVKLTHEQEETLNHIKNKLKEKGLSKIEMHKILHKQKSRMVRTLKRRIKTCFKCRQEGHVLSDCPLNESDEGCGICFKCGSSEHKSSECKKIKAPGENQFPYATCFICGNQGHLSSQCVENSGGIFPKGGACYLCGSVNHMKKDCPQLKEESSYVNNVTVHRLDDDNVEAEMFEESKKHVSSKRNRKIIAFK